MLVRRRRRAVPMALAALLAGCSDEQPPRDLGPAPDGSYRQRVQERQDEVFAARYELEGPSTFRFADPAPGRVARWHWEPQEDGRSHSLGYRHGWCVEFWVRPDYRGFPEQPESHRMAFFAGGALRAIFAEGCRNAPLELDRWSPEWLGPDWEPPTAVPGK